MRKSGSSTAARACSRKGNFYMQVRLTTPLTRQELAPLHAGDTVLLTGTVYTARDAAHARMMELLDKGEELPFPIEGAAVRYQRRGHLLCRSHTGAPRLCHWCGGSHDIRPHG